VGENELKRNSFKARRHNAHGVPYLKPTEIEAIAYEALERYCPHLLRKAGITPVAEILNGLHQNTGLLIA